MNKNEFFSVQKSLLSISTQGSPRNNASGTPPAPPPLLLFSATKWLIKMNNYRSKFNNKTVDSFPIILENADIDCRYLE